MIAPRWTVTMLTIPGREDHLRILLESLARTTAPGGAVFVVVYNRPPEEPLPVIEGRIKALSSGLPLEIYFNSADPTIASGRNLQLTLCKTPLICFIDDDVTVHGNPFETLEEAFKRYPVGLAGLRSYVGDTDEIFKPRAGTPAVVRGDFQFQSVQGMLAAGYTRVLQEVGGFNPRRRFWGEWTELNLRLWRSGFPTGIAMLGSFLRHWEDAPDSPTRSLEGRAQHVLWGLICTALEYDVMDVNSATETFWRLAEERYLAYSFGDDLSHRELLRVTLTLMPELSRHWGDITAFREQVARHPYPFMPFHPISEQDVNRILPAAERALRPHRQQLWPRLRRTGVFRRLLRGLGLGSRSG